MLTSNTGGQGFLTRTGKIRLGLFCLFATPHNAVAVSTRRGASASTIQSAISGNEGGMGSLSTLTTAQIQAIAAVLAFPE
jgi:hypothetical protein